jgi:phospholipid/cholesterol/gamma-HCH transport system substrate-binding protein
VAGASYLELTRGSGEPLDWEYAVLTATAERAPTDTVSALITEIQSKVVPLIEDAQVAMHTLTALAVGLQDPNGNLQRLLTDLHTMTGRLERGEGAVGRLLNRDREKPRDSPLPHHPAYGSVPWRFDLVTCGEVYTIG